jgi:hypothetical protein
MRSKNVFIGLGLGAILLGLAAFVAGRMLNGKTGTVMPGGPNSGRVSISLDEITPAPELPGTKADVTGSFMARTDNSIQLQAVSFGMGNGRVSADTPLDENSGIRVEIVVTGKTEIYRDITQFPAPVNGEIHNVQQVVEAGTLDDLNPQSFLSVWGRRNGDRIVAETLFYSNPQTIKKPGSQ